MAMEHKFPNDLHTSNDLRRFVHLTPSIPTDSEHEVLVELDSDSDAPLSKSRTDRHASSAAAKDRSKLVDRKKRTSTNERHADAIVSQDMLYHLMDQNKVLMDQNKVLMDQNEVLTKRVKLLEPAVDYSPPPPEPKFMCGSMVGLDRDLPRELAEPTQPPKPKPEPKKLEDDKLYAEYTEIWDVLPRLLRFFETAAKPRSTDTDAVTKPDLVNEMFAVDPFSGLHAQMFGLPPLEAPFTNHALMLLSKNSFLAALANAEHRVGVNQRGKNAGKKAKSRPDAWKSMSFNRADLVPGFWKALGVVRIFLLLFIMMQLSTIGGDVMRVSKGGAKSSAWLGFW